MAKFKVILFFFLSMFLSSHSEEVAQDAELVAIIEQIVVQFNLSDLVSSSDKDWIKKEVLKKEASRSNKFAEKKSTKREAFVFGVLVQSFAPFIYVPLLVSLVDSAYDPVFINQIEDNKMAFVSGMASMAALQSAVIYFCCKGFKDSVKVWVRVR